MKCLKEIKSGQISRVSDLEALRAVATGDFSHSSKQAWKKQVRHPEESNQEKKSKKTVTKKRKKTKQLKSV